MSLPTIVVQPDADDEIDEIARYIARDNLEAGKRFYDAVEDALEKLARMPGMGAIREVRKPALQGLRSWPIRHYENYLIFYRPLKEGGIEVLHVLHGARNVERIVERGT